MIDKVTKYYQSLFSRIHPENLHTLHLETCYTQNAKSGFGTIIYQPQNRGFYGIIDDQGNAFYPINLGKHQHLLKDRQRIQFQLQILPEVPNIQRWGCSVSIYSVRFIG